MANAIEILINARDNASGPVRQAAVSVESLAKAAAASILTFSAMQFTLQAVAQTTVGLARGFADEVEQLGRLSTVTGLSAEQLQVFRRGLEQNGLQADQLGLALRYFQTQLANNSKEMAVYGITSSNTFTALQQLRRALDGAGNDAERTALAAATLGQRNVELADTVTKTATAYDSQLNEAMSRGSIIVGEQQELFGSLDETVDSFTDTMRNLQIAAAQTFTPLLKFLGDTLNLANRVSVAFDQFMRRFDRGLVNGVFRAFGAGSTGGQGGGTWMSNGDSEPFDQAAWLARYKARQQAGTAGAAGFDMAAGLPALGLLYGTGGNALGLRGDGGGVGALGKVLEQVEPVAQDLGDTFKAMSATLTDLSQRTYAFGAQLSASIATAISSWMQGTMNAISLIRSVIESVFQAVAEAIAQYLADQLVGFGLELVGGIVGGPAGVAIGAVGKGIRGASATGGNTYVVQSIDSKSALDALMAPTGSLRGANDRMLEVSMAGRL